MVAFGRLKRFWSIYTSGVNSDIPVCCSARFAWDWAVPNPLLELIPHELLDRIRGLSPRRVLSARNPVGYIPCEYHVLKWVLTGKYPRIREGYKEEPPEFVVIESPYAADTEEEIAENELYASAAMRWCLLQDMKPYASHLLYTRKGILDDKDPEERRRGIEAGLRWSDAVADATFVFIDKGITGGMEKGIKRAEKQFRRVARVELGPHWRKWLGPTAP
jgi:hypothetical protein